MTKYHVNEKGVVGECRVTVQVCRFAPEGNPDGNHYLTKVEAQKAADKKMESENGILSTLRKSAVKPLKMKVYRSGPVEPPAKRGVEKECYADVDEFRPEGRQGRSNGIFASPSLRGVHRWAKANATMTRNPDALVREITVDANSVYVYKVRDWEQASYRWDYRNVNPESQERYKLESENFWNNGITLKEWTDTIDPSEADEWELLLNDEDVQSVRPVSDKRLIETVPEYPMEGEYLMKIFKQMRWNLKEKRKQAALENQRLDS